MFVEMMWFRWLDSAVQWDWMKNVTSTRKDLECLDTWGLAAINLFLSVFGAYMTTTIMVPHPAPTDDPETGASEAKAKTLTGWRAESKSRRSIEWLEMHLSTLVGSTAFLLSALSNFSSVYFRSPQQTGRTRTSDMVIVATLQVSSTVYTGRGRVAGIIPTHDPTVVAGPVSWLYGIYVISGMLNVLALVGLYRWWREEKNRARKW